MLDTQAAAPSSVIAFVTAIHAALLVFQLQQGRSLARVLGASPAVVLGAAAWVLSAPAWLGTGVAADVLWTLVAVKAIRRDPRHRRAEEAGFVPARVLAVIRETEAIRTFRLARPRGFDFRAGQFLMVRLVAGGRRIARCYSISSSPRDRRHLEISVRRQGLVSGALHDSLHPGSMLFVHPPLGDFGIPEHLDGPLVLVAGGIGITPLISIARDVTRSAPGRPVTLLYSAKSREELAFREELLSLAARHPLLRVVFTVTAGEADASVRRGRIDERLVREVVADPRNGVFLICGPLPMIDAMRSLAARLGASEERIRSEAFEAASAIASRAAPDAAGAGGRLRLAVSECEIVVEPSETLLDAAARAGVAIPSFCRAGICGTCRTRLISGDVRSTAEGLSEDDHRRGDILPCASWASGDCVLEA